MKQKFLEKYRGDKVLLGEWIIAAFTAVFLFCTVMYVDMRSLTIWSTNVWDVTVDSNIRNLYEYTAQNTHGLRHTYLGSELFSILPWSIWNFPIWCIQRFGGKDIADSAILLAYSKLFLVLLSMVTLHYTKKITYLITGDKTKTTWAVFLSASSVYLYMGVFYAGQNDIIMITASVIAVYKLLCKKQGMFLLWSAIAIAIKPFFLFAFLAVLLLIEKNILRLIGKAAIGAAGLVLQKLLFYGAPMYQESMSQGPSIEMLENMFSENLSTSFGPVSFLAIALVLIYFYCYTRDFDVQRLGQSDKRLEKYVIYMITVTYMAYLMFSPFTFYRLTVLIPFLYIVIVQNDAMPFYNGLFDTAMSLSLLVKMAIRSNASFMRTKAINGALVQRLFGYSVTPNAEEGAYTGIASYMKSTKNILLAFQPLFSGVALICALLLLAYNHPDRKLKAPLYSNKNCRILLWGKILAFIPFILIVMVLFMKAPIKLY